MDEGKGKEAGAEDEAGLAGDVWRYLEAKGFFLAEDADHAAGGGEVGGVGYGENRPAAEERERFGGGKHVEWDEAVVSK